jgi:hypothetical protein
MSVAAYNVRSLACHTAAFYKDMKPIAFAKMAVQNSLVCFRWPDTDVHTRFTLVTDSRIVYHILLSEC